MYFPIFLWQCNSLALAHQVKLVGSQNTRKLDLIADWLKDIIRDYNLVDIRPPRLAPTWDNGRTGDMHVAKTLDRFPLHEHLIDRLGLIHSGIINSFIPDHKPIILKWNRDDLKMGVPFKFTQVRLEDTDFDIFVREFWSQYRAKEASPMEVIMEKLHALKVVVKRWERKKKNQMNKDLKDISNEMDRLGLQLQRGHPSRDLLTSIRLLEEKRLSLLHIQEVTWHLKSRALWIQEGDRNTEFFHRHASHRRKIKTIWDMKDSDGNLIQTL
eukprot:PITA_02178